MEKVTIHNLVILDESGSMHEIRQQAIAGLNDTVGTIRAAQQQYPDQLHRLTMVTFSSDFGKQPVRYIADDLPIAKVPKIEDDKYIPRGGTPLYDAMGTCIDRLRSQCNDGDQVLVTVITDGMENSSHEFSSTAIKSIVGLLREKGWVFAYIGANQDAVEVASELNIDNAMNYESSKEGTAVMFNCCCKSSVEAFNRISEGKRGKELSHNYFSKGQAEE